MCLRRQKDIPWEKRKTLEGVSSSRWVRGLGLVKDPQPARPRGRKEAIKRPASGLSAGHYLIFIVMNNYVHSRAMAKTENEREREKERKKLRWRLMGGVTVCWKRGRLSRQTTSYWSLIIPWRPRENPIKASSLRLDHL